MNEPKPPGEDPRQEPNAGSDARDREPDAAAPGTGETLSGSTEPAAADAEAPGAPGNAIAAAPHAAAPEAGEPSGAAAPPGARDEEAAPPPRGGTPWYAEREETPEEFPDARLRAQSRRAFLVYSAGAVASVLGAWWLLPPATKRNLLPGAHDRLDTLAARIGLSPARAERTLDRSLTFDDDVAEALYSKDRRMRTYAKSDARPLRNNYNGRTPGPEYLDGWTLELSGLASGRIERLDLDALVRGLAFREQVTRLVCVEGWSGVAWWGGVRFADLLEAFPPAPGARWASLRSAVNLDGRGRPDPYYVSIDLDTARHPQTLLATHPEGRPLTLAHGAPLRLLAPMKLGLKNIKAITSITYSASEPPDYWNERGYSKYDGL